MSGGGTGGHWSAARRLRAHDHGMCVDSSKPGAAGPRREGCLRLTVNIGRQARLSSNSHHVAVCCEPPLAAPSLLGLWGEVLAMRLANCLRSRLVSKIMDWCSYTSTRWCSCSAPTGAALPLLRHAAAAEPRRCRC